MRIGITGSTGLLGGSLRRLIAQTDDLQVVAIDRTAAKISSLPDMTAYLKNLDIDVLIHCAANTNVEACETNQDACFRDNWILTTCLVEASRACDARFVFISSTGLYGDHSDHPYKEYDDARPTTAHHKSKFLAEQAVLGRGIDSLIIRTGWLFGGPATNPKNFVANRLREAFAAQTDMQSDTSQTGNPTFVDDVSEHIVSLLRTNLTGVFNCVSAGAATRFDYVHEIVALSGVDIKVNPVDGSHFKRHAKVSPNESAVNYRLTELGLNTMPSWKMRLGEYIPTLLKELEIER